MPLDDKFFYCALFFLFGVLFKSLEFGIWTVLITAILAVFFLVLGCIKKRKNLFWLAFLSVSILFGALYYTADDLSFKNVNIVFDNKTDFAGVIINQPVYKNSFQEFKVKLNKPQKGNVLVKASPYPEFHYGDELNLIGTIEKPEPKSYENYLAKERIGGIFNFPEIELQSSDNGNFLKSFLFNFKNRIIMSFEKILPQKEASFLSGITLGERGSFSKEFKEAMSLSGTTHIVALSGYNITIIAWALMGISISFLKRRIAFLLTIIFIVLFVLMTGGEASVVRAAIMGILVLLSREIGRFYDFRNAIILAALIMVLFNPKTLIFDIGFQLSFLALLGIVYLRPVIMKVFRFSENPGFLSWKDNLLTTLSAQLAVMPILISNFGNFSLTSLLANVIILETIPVAMGLGFIIAFSSFFSYYLSLVLGWLVWVILRFQIFLIEFFAKLSLPISRNLGIVFSIVYYLSIIVLIWYARRKFDLKIQK